MKSLNTQQIQELDRLAIEWIGIPSMVLMENAGRAVVQEVWRALANRLEKQVVILAGVGNNGGDGLVVGRYLLEKGSATRIYVVGELPDLKNDSKAQYQILRKLGHHVQFIQKLSDDDVNHIKSCGVIIDALFGVGLNRLISEPFQSIVSLINQSQKHVISIDIPTGLNATTGEIFGSCVKADSTVTFSFPKEGFFNNDGPKYTGQIVVADIGIPQGLFKKIDGIDES
jgi:NAD(P)H-hydrate epimerase